MSRPATPALAAGAVLAQTVTMAVLFAVALGLLGDDDPFDGSLRDFLVVAGMHLTDGLLVLGLVLRSRSWADLGWAPPADAGRTVALGVAGALVCAAIVASTGLLVGGVDGLWETVAGFARMPLQTRLLCALIGLGAAVIEESVFRGTLQPALVARLGRPAGILVAAVIFSAYHLKFAPIGFVVKAVFGVLFGSLREATGRCWAPALAHLGVWVIVGFA